MTCHLTFPSRVDVASVGALCESWRQELHAQGQVEIDCSGLEFFSAAAAQIVVAIDAAVQEVSGSLVLKNVPSTLRNDFALLGVSHYIG